MSVANSPEVLVLDNVSKAFGGFYAVHGVSFAVRQGEVFGFLGPNGAGKSTTIRLILDILRPTAGEVTIFGADSRQSVKTRRRLGYLSGDMVLDMNLTGLQYLDFVAAQYGKDCREKRLELSELLQADLSKKIGDYSRGNRQKIGLITALQHEPELLILDEPTSGFDPLVQEQFATLVRQFKDRGGTVFMSSHILSEVQQLCDRVAFIKDGRIIDATTVEGLTANAAKRVNVKASAPELVRLRKQLTALKGVRIHPAVEEWTIQFSYSGDMSHLVKVLAMRQVQDLTIEEPELEEIFMHYYEKGAGEKGVADPVSAPQEEAS